jgi:hypothetical protein
LDIIQISYRKVPQEQNLDGLKALKVAGCGKKTQKGGHEKFS